MADANHVQAQNEAQYSYWVAGTSLLHGSTDWMAGPSTLSFYLRNIPSGSFFQVQHAGPPAKIMELRPIVQSAAPVEQDEEENKKFVRINLLSEPADRERLSSREGIQSFSGSGRGNFLQRSNAPEEMTLAEYEKVYEEKRKPLQALKTEERKVDPKEFEYVPRILGKKGNDEVYIKSKDKKKESVGKKQKVKKFVKFNLLSEPADGERLSSREGIHSGGRSSSNHSQSSVAAPATDSFSYFPTLGGRGSGGSSSNDSQSSVAAPPTEDLSPSPALGGN